MIEDKTIPISIIVPVYNVFDWLDECMQSIVDQTFRDFEIILINDGSTDGSDKKCLDWRQKDSRIRYIDKKNEGLSLTRNLGLKEAKGEFIVFIDSDDWLELEYIEKLYHIACKTGADIVECDFWRFNNNTGEKTYRPCYGRMGKEYSVEERMIYGESTAWKYMSKKKFWLEHNIVMPNCLGASHVVYMLLLALGASIVNIHEPLYYYRRMRKGSILDINGKGLSEDGKMGLRELDIFIEEFKKRDLYDKYQNIIEKAVKYRMSDLLAAQFARKNRAEFELQFKNYYEYIDDKFPRQRNHKYLMLGGYNLNRILSYLPEINNPYYRFNFSSIISIMHPVKEIGIYYHKNEYRMKMVQRDIHSSFWDIVEEAKPSYLFIDLLDERFDLVKTREGGFITKSDAFDGLEKNGIEGDTIKRKSRECEKQWRKDCNAFFELIQKNISLENIFLIENYLSEETGDMNSRKQYENIEEIQSINSLLKSYYDYIKEKFKNIRYIEAYKRELYFTDKNYEYGAIPSHLNEVVNKKIAALIETEMKINE